MVQQLFIQNTHSQQQQWLMMRLRLRLRQRPAFTSVVQSWVESLGEKQNTEKPEKINFLKKRIVVLANNGCCAISIFKYYLYLNLPRFTSYIT